jgi:hypothetical protein
MYVLRFHCHEIQKKGWKSSFAIIQPCTQMWATFVHTFLKSRILSWASLPRLGYKDCGFHFGCLIRFHVANSPGSSQSLCHEAVLRGGPWIKALSPANVRRLEANCSSIPNHSLDLTSLWEILSQNHLAKLNLEFLPQEIGSNIFLCCQVWGKFVTQQ